MQDTVFRQYDIRGRVGDEFSVDKVADLGRAIAYYFLQKNSSVKTVALGIDGRVHSQDIKNRLVPALLESGLDVIFVGLCPSPVLYFGLHTLTVQAGIMVTASHNPQEYNGLKICLGKDSVWGAEIAIIKQFFQEGKKVTPVRYGKYTEHVLIDSYVASLVEQFSHLKGLSLSAVIDCGNSAGAAVIPALVKAMGWQEVDLLCTDIGVLPKHDADPVVPENMYEVKEHLLHSTAQIGIGLDGDADRMAAMTKDGYLVPGDKLLALFFEYMIKSHPGMHLVLDIKSSQLLIELVHKWGGVAHMAPSGHAIIKEHMKKHNALLGGELSCHFVFNDRYYGYDDGIYAMMRLFEIIQATDTSLEKLLEVFPLKASTPELRINCSERGRKDSITTVYNYFSTMPDAQLITLDGVRVTIDNAWGIIRSSNTQPVICLRFEADTKKELACIIDHFSQALQGCIDTSLLESYKDI